MNKLKGNTSHKSKKSLESKVDIIELIVSHADNIQPPEWMNDLAKIEYRRIVPLLIESGVLTFVDLGTLELYCQAYGNWKNCEQIVGRDGYTIEYTNKAKETNTIEHPAAKMAQKYAVLAKQYLEQLGLSPKSRSRLDIKLLKKESDELIDFIKSR